MSRRGLASSLPIWLMLPAAALADCDATGDHIRWVDGFNYLSYSPGYGYTGFVDAAIRVGDAVVISVGDQESVLSFEVLSDGQLEPADSLPMDVSTRLVEAGNDVVCGSSDDEIAVISLDNDANMTVSGTVPLPAANLVANGDYLYASNTTGFYVIDVSDPVQPTVVGQATGPVGQLAAEGERAYVLTTSEMWSVDVSDPTSPSFVQSFHPSAFRDRIQAKDGYLYAANRSEGLEVFDLSSPDLPELETTIPVDNAHSLVLGDDHLLCNGRLFDLSTPGAPIPLGAVGGIGGDIENGYVYVAAGGEGLQVFAIGAGTNPEPVASWDDGSQAMDLIPLGDYLVYQTFTSIDVLDVSDPLNPSFITSMQISSKDMVHQDGYLYVAGADGFTVVDVSNPASPSVVGSLTGWNIELAAISGTRLYGATIDGVLILDASVPGSPTLLGGFPLPDVRSLAARGTDLYVVTDFEGNGDVYRVDCSDPGWVFFDASYGGGAGGQVRCDDTYVYVSGREGIAQLDPETLDIMSLVGERSFATRDLVLGSNGKVYGLTSSDLHGFKSSPTLEYAFGGPANVGAAYGMAEVEGFLYVSGFSRLNIFDPSCAPSDVETEAGSRRELRLTAAPNPSSGAVRFHFEREVGRSSHLELFDSSGRILASIEVSDESSQIQWDGRDDHGRVVPTGVIFARLKTPQGTASGTVRIVR